MGAVLVEQQLPVLVGHQEPRRDGVAADAAAREVGGQPLGEVADRRLRPGVRRNLGQRNIGVHGADVENHAAFALHHVLGEGLGGQQGTLEVQLEHKVHAPCVQVKKALLTLLLLVLVLVVRGGPGVVAARPVHQNIAGAQVLEHLLMHRLQGLRLQHVGLVALTDEALGFALVGQLFDRFLIQVQSRHLRARLGERLRHGAAQHAARAGDYHHFAGEINFQR